MVRKEKKQARWEAKRKQIVKLKQPSQVYVENKDPNIEKCWLLEQKQCSKELEEKYQIKEIVKEQLQGQIELESNICNHVLLDNYSDKKIEQVNVSVTEEKEKSICSKEEYEFIIKQISNQDFCDRDKQIQAIKQFIMTPLANVLYVCGSTGTGKTTTILKTLQSANIKYTLINCLNYPRQKNGQDYLKNILSLAEQDQTSINGLLIIDECEFSNDIARDIKIIRQSIANQKIILICNNRSVEFSESQQLISTLLFLPYSQTQAIRIAKLKLKLIYKKIPELIFRQGAKKTNKSGGDFREMQKHITEWAFGQINHDREENVSKVFKLTNPSIEMLQCYLKSNSKKKNSLLGLIVETSQKEQKKERDDECACKSNQVSKLLKRSGWRKMQFQYTLKQFEQMGLIKIAKGRCHWHSKLIPMLRIKVKRNQKQLKNLLMKNGYLN